MKQTINSLIEMYFASSFSDWFFRFMLLNKLDYFTLFAILQETHFRYSVLQRHNGFEENCFLYTLKKLVVYGSMGIHNIFTKPYNITISCSNYRSFMTSPPTLVLRLVLVSINHSCEKETIYNLINKNEIFFKIIFYMD